jgi:oxygen-independent coproporphyrinogen-3 oxidase
MMMENNEQPTSAYIHIPFCQHLCYYCDFAKVLIENQPVDEYLAMLQKEMTMTVGEKKQVLQTCYIGGGTPSALSEKQLATLLMMITAQFTIVGEFTIEVNPGDLTREKVQLLRHYGVNRVSMGVQTFDDRLLRKIGRKHTSKDVYATIDLLRAEQFENISIDLIFALPGQSLASFRESLTKALALDLPHYALYSLILENKTVFMNQVRKGKLVLPEQEIEAQMFTETIAAMTAHKRAQYEISNFAKAGFASQHNLVYWHNQQYYGFGAGASGYIGNVRYKNRGPIQHYLTAVQHTEFPRVEEEELTEQAQMEEQMFLGLRLAEGVSVTAFDQRFSQTFANTYQAVATALEKKGWLTITGDRIQLTSAGKMLGNEVFQAFLIDE